ncbi:hypothetical protein [Pectobacterium versatile]|uniref:hypothetical protein n=1 Tax=Pectobacterium versatile TaxID=2488639 RepID=UPI0019695CFA|nr:hypothetical protein [Pectobacterium versatile]MBN3239949.1 hypothetical protein [Pectobacterium versatile]MBQ4790017.1 hypothetical protein [Pectobacterium versatile]
MDGKTDSNDLGLINYDGISINTSTHVIAISQDKLLRILDKYTQKVSTQKQWVTPLSISFTLLVSLLTSDFKDFFGISALTWKAAFIIVLILCISSALYLFRKSDIPPTVDELVNEIKELK